MPSDSIVFVDTNVLLYAQDPRDEVKRSTAERWLVWCWQAQRARISTQVLNELYVNVRRLAPQMAVEAARALVRRYRVWNPWAVDGATVDIAWRLQDQYSVNYWDALMLAAAREQGCRYLLSEDMQHGQHIEDLQIINPFLVEPSALGLVAP